MSHISIESFRLKSKTGHKHIPYPKLQEENLSALVEIVKLKNEYF
jgi:hypothetical protein